MSKQRMERLTYKLAQHSHCLKDKASAKVGLFTDYDGFYAYLTATERLGELEDILGEEYDLDKLRELVQGIKSGQFILANIRRGETVYFVLEDDECPGGWIVSEPHTVTEVGTRGFWTSGLPAESPDGMHDFTTWEELGKSAFLDEGEAKRSMNMQTSEPDRELSVGKS